MATEKLWGGRFSGNTDATVEAFTASEHLDRRLAEYDIAGSRAHALMLQACGIINEVDCQAIIDGLDTITQEISAGRFPLVRENFSLMMFREPAISPFCTI